MSSCEGVRPLNATSSPGLSSFVKEERNFNHDLFFQTAAPVCGSRAANYRPILTGSPFV